MTESNRIEYKRQLTDRLEAYNVFETRESFVRIALPYAKPLDSLRDVSEQGSDAQVTPQVTPQV